MSSYPYSLENKAQVTIQGETLFNICGNSRYARVVGSFQSCSLVVKEVGKVIPVLLCNLFDSKHPFSSLLVVPANGTTVGCNSPVSRAVALGLLPFHTGVAATFAQLVTFASVVW